MSLYSSFISTTVAEILSINEEYEFMKDMQRKMERRLIVSFFNSSFFDVFIIFLSILFCLYLYYNIYTDECKYG